MLPDYNTKGLKGFGPICNLDHLIADMYFSIRDGICEKFVALSAHHHKILAMARLFQAKMKFESFCRLVVIGSSVRVLARCLKIREQAGPCVFDP
jgi:hypothetical protein